MSSGLAPWVLGDDDFRAALVEGFDDPVGVKRFVGDQPAEIDAFDQRRDADGVKALARHQDKTDEIAQSVGEREDLGRQPALRLAYGLALSPPFAPCPWRWTLTMVASTMAYSMSGSSETASNIRLKTSAFTHGGTA